MKNKEVFQNGEADQWFRRNKEALETSTSDPDMDLLADWMLPFKTRISSVMEVGCGTGHKLDRLSRALDAKGCGIEPSAEAVAHISDAFPDLDVKQAFADDIPFSEQFDLVHLGFFLYLVDREAYFSCLKEADRLVKPGGFLSIIDFDPPAPYSNAYSHQPGAFSHKIDNSGAFTASGLYSVVNKYSFSHSNFHFDEIADERVSLVLLYKETNVFGAR